MKTIQSNITARESRCPFNSEDNNERCCFIEDKHSFINDDYFNYIGFCIVLKAGENKFIGKSSDRLAGRWGN